MHDTDGRLDLDELGEVIDRASALQPLEVLGEERTTPTWGERLDDTGVTAWVRGHRLLLGATVVAALALGTGITGYAVSRPPSVDPTIHAEIVEVEATPLGQQGFDSDVGVSAHGDVRRSAYRVVLDPVLEAGSTARIVGLTGPAIRTSQAAPQPADASGVVPGYDVDAIVDCASIPPPAQADPYLLTVERTDAWGRTVSAAFPAPEVAAQWRREIRRSCLQNRAWTDVRLTALRVAADPEHDQVDLQLDLANDFDEEMFLGISESYGPTPVWVPSMSQSAPAHGAVTIPLSLTVQDCRAAALDPASAPEPGTDPDEDRWSELPGFYLIIDSGVVEGGATGVARFTPANVSALTAAFAKVCAGSPATVISLVSSEPLRVRTTGGDQVVEVTTALTLDVATSGTRVAVGDPDYGTGMNGIMSTVRARTADVKAGRARVRTEWLVDCSQGVVEPPALRVDVTTPRGEFPYLYVLRDGAIAQTVIDACPTIAPQTMRDVGWELP